MKQTGDFGRLLWLVRTYLAPRWRAVVLLLAGSYLTTALAALAPVLMAPILDLALGNPIAAAPVSLDGLSLKNLGSAFFQWFGIGSIDDRFRAIVLLCVAYVVVGFVKGWVEFGNYVLALWLRLRASAALQMDLFRHLLGLSMSFFNRQRTGELVSRLSTDTLAVSAGLESIVSRFLTAPVLIVVYGYLLVRTSPILVVAALGAAGLQYGVTRAVRGPIRRFVKINGTIARHVPSAVRTTRKRG